MCGRCFEYDRTCVGLGYGVAAPAAAAVAAPAVADGTLTAKIIVPRGPSSVPELDGSSDARDLLLLVPYAASGALFGSAAVEADYLISRLKGVFSYSYIYHLPSRLGQSTTLDNAISCTAAALRCVYGRASDPEKAAGAAWKLYGKALQGLRNDLQSSECSVLAETLCATGLLSFFEARILCFLG